MLVLVAGLGFWLIAATITGAVISSATIEVDSIRQIVQHPQGGVVAGVRARDGQLVSAGDVLLRLDMVQQHAELHFAKLQLFELQARQKRFRAEQPQSEEVVFDEALISLGMDDASFPADLEGQKRLFHATRNTIIVDQTKLLNRKNQILAQITGF